MISLLSTTLSKRRLLLAGSTLLATLIGLAAVGTLRSARAAEAPLLPRLEAETPDGAYLETNASELAGGNRLLLKFNGYIHNGGQGAVDVRGNRTEPSISSATRKKVEKDRAEERETLGESELNELATPKMTVTQREFLPGGNEENVQRTSYVPHTISPKAELFYSASDGHDHWHLQHVAKYQLSTMAAEKVSPGQKVGFCLDDSLHRDPSKGPSKAAYSDATGRDFCQKFKPETTEVWEGISPGWSDLYGNYLAWQFVDVSNVIPGEYQIEEEVDPEHLLEEESGGEKNSSSLPVIVPGYNAEAVSASTEEGVAKVIPLKSKAWKVTTKSELENPESHKKFVESGLVYKVSSEAANGKVTISGTSATYTPNPGFSGTDHFRYIAREKESEFPKAPIEATATVAVAKGASKPEVTITEAPSGMTTGTTAPLHAVAAGDGSAIEWNVSGGGSIVTGGNGETATLTAPASPATIKVTATLADKKASATREIPVTAPAPNEPAPSVPGETKGSGSGGSTGSGGSGGVAGTSTAKGLSRPRAMLYSHKLVITTTPYGGGRIKVQALLGKHVLGTCQALTPAKRQFTCRIKLPEKLSLRAHIAIVATLKEGPGPHDLFTSKLAAHEIPQMKMVPAGSATKAAAHAAAVTGFWCSPEMLVPTLAYE